MEAGDWIGLYAALCATTAIAWQIRSYALERKSKLRVRLSLMHLIHDEKSALVDYELLVQGEWWLECEILNLGRSEARISDVVFETLRSADGVESWTSRDWELPWVLPPYDNRTIQLTDEQAGKIKVGQEFVAIATTTDGREFRSEKLQVGDKGGETFMVLPVTVMNKLEAIANKSVYKAQRREFGGQAPSSTTYRASGSRKDLES